MGRRPSLGTTLVEVLVAVAIVVICASLLLAAVQRVREAANRTRCHNNLHQISLALLAYHDSKGSFPSASRGITDDFPFLAWSARILPYLEQDAVWRQTVIDYRQSLGNHGILGYPRMQE